MPTVQPRQRAALVLVTVVVCAAIAFVVIQKVRVFFEPEGEGRRADITGAAESWASGIGFGSQEVMLHATWPRCATGIVTTAKQQHISFIATREGSEWSIVNLGAQSIDRDEIRTEQECLARVRP